MAPLDRQQRRKERERGAGYSAKYVDAARLLKTDN